MNDPIKSDSALGPYRVLDLTEGGCMIGARLLADLGADVIKIEPPAGSPSRIAPYYKNVSDPQKSLYWFAYNLNKRGVTLDIRTETGQNQFKKLVQSADIVMESFPPGYLARFGLGYDDLFKIKADIIMAAITPFGQSGPKAHYKGSDLTASASGGNLYIAGDPDRAPTWISFPQASLFGGAEAAVGILTALWYRQATGEGQYVDVSLQECALSPTQNTLPFWAADKKNFQRCGDALLTPATGIKLPTYYKCKDGSVFFFLQGGNEPFVSSTKRLVEWMDEEGMSADWLNHLDFTVDFNAVTLNQDMVDRVAAMVGRFMATKTKQELYEEGGIKRRILTAPIYNTRDICEDVQLKYRSYWEKIEHPELGRSLTYCGPFVRMSATPVMHQRRPPLIGEHNAEIFETEINQTKVDAEENQAERDEKKVFAGIKVAEFAWQLVGPLTSKYLADHGATVIRIESHYRPDTLRMVPPFAGDTAGVDSSMFYARGGANKYCVTIDLNHPAGRKLAWKLIMWADILTQSFSPGIMQRWGLDYDSVSKVKPDIIYLSSSMQGQDGPHARYAGYGQSACALSGFSEISGWPDRLPAPPYGAYTDYLCPRLGATALIAALEYRRRTGKGQLLEQSQFESAVHFLAPPIMDYRVNGSIAGRHGNRLDQAAPHGLFACKGDDCWVAISVMSDAEWQAFCDAIGSPDWTRQPEFATLAKRKQNEDQLEKRIAAWTLAYTAEQIESDLQRAGVAAGVVAKPSDIYADSQIKHRHYFTGQEHPVMGKQDFETQACYILSKTPRQITRPSPCLGEHNTFVFQELLGMTNDEIADHIADGSITTDLPGDFKAFA